MTRLPLLALLVVLITLTGCSTKYPNQNPVGQMFPTVSGNSLDKKPVTLPEFTKGDKALLLLGYRQGSQFDIDRWLVGLDMTKTKINVLEVPAVQGFFPSLISDRINDGMRGGIPVELWSIVVTVYDDGEKIQKFTGNTNPRNARVVLLNEDGKVIHFYDRGFSVDALNAVREKITTKE